MKSTFGLSENTITSLTESGKALHKRVYDISLVLWILIIAYDYSFVIDGEGKISPTEAVFHILFNISAAIAVFVTYRFGRKKRDLKYAMIYLQGSSLMFCISAYATINICRAYNKYIVVGYIILTAAFALRCIFLTRREILKSKTN